MISAKLFNSDILWLEGVSFACPITKSLFKVNLEWCAERVLSLRLKWSDIQQNFVTPCCSPLPFKCKSRKLECEF